MPELDDNPYLIDTGAPPPSAPPKGARRGFRTDRNNNPIAAAVGAGSKNQFTKALDDAGIEWEPGDPFPANEGGASMRTIRIKGDPVEGARAILSRSNALQGWYANKTGRNVLPRYNVRTNQDFARLPTAQQNEIIHGIYMSEGGSGNLTKLHQQQEQNPYLVDSTRPAKPDNPYLIAEGETPEVEQPEITGTGRGAGMARATQSPNTREVRRFGTGPLPYPTLTTNDTEWYFGENIPNPSRRALKALSAAKAEDDRKRTAGQTEFVRSPTYQAEMRRRAGLNPLPAAPSRADLERESYRNTSLGELRQSEDEPIGFSRQGQPSRVTQTADELRVMKGEQPVNRQSYAHQQELQSRVPEEVYADRVAREQREAPRQSEAEVRYQKDKPEIDRLAKQYQNLIKGSGRMRGEQWSAETLAKGGAGLTDALAALLRTGKFTPIGQLAELAKRGTPDAAADALQRHAQAIQQAAEAEGVDRNEASKIAQNVIGGFIGSVPELAAMSTGLPAPLVFAAGSGARAYGARKPVVPAAVHGALTGAAFEVPIEGALAKGATVGGLTGALDLAAGASPREALTSGAMNALMAASGGRKDANETTAVPNTPEYEANYGRRRPDNNVLPVEEVASMAGETNAPRTNPQADDIGATTAAVAKQGERLDRDAADQQMIREQFDRLKAAAEAKSVHHSELQPRNEVGQFDGPPVEPTPKGLADRPFITILPDGAMAIGDEVFANREAAAEKYPELAGKGTERGSRVADLEAKLAAQQSEPAENPEARATAIADTRKALEAARKEEVAAPEVSPSVREGPPREPLGQIGSASLSLDRNYSHPIDEDVALDTGNVVNSGTEIVNRIVAEVDGREVGHLSFSKDGQVVEVEVLPEFRRQKIATSMYDAAAKTIGRPLRAGEFQTSEGKLFRSVYDAKAKFEDWSMEMRRRLGEDVAPHLKTVWAQLRGELPEGVGTPVRTQDIERERAEAGLSPIEKQQYRSVGESFFEGKKAIEAKEIDPRLLAAEVNDKPRPLTSKEVGALAYDRATLKGQYNDLVKQIGDSDDPVALASIRAQMEEVERQGEVNDAALEKGGREQSIAFNARKMVVNEDLSDLLHNILRAKANKGGEISDATRKTITDLTDRLKTAEEKLAKHEVSKGDEAINKLVRDQQYQSRKAGRARSREVLATERVTIKQQIATAWAKVGKSNIAGMAAVDPEGELAKLIGALARNYVEDGVVKAADLVDAVHETVKDVTDLTKDRVRTLISGYGKTQDMSKDAVTLKLGEIKDILRKMEAYEGVTERGEVPKRSGLQRPKPSQEMREWQKKLSAAMREYGVELERAAKSPEERQQTALDTAKTTVRNRIEDLKQWINDGKRTVASKTEIIPDVELTALRAERDQLTDVFKALDDPDADQKSIDNALKIVNKSIADLDTKIKLGDLAPKLRQTVAPWSEELGKQQQHRAELQKQLADMRQTAKPKPDPGTVRIEAALKTAERSIEGIRGRLQTGELTNKSASSAPWSPELGQAKREQASLQKQLDAARRAARPVVDEAQRAIEQSLKTAEKSIASLEKRIKDNQTAPTLREGAQTAYSPEISAAKKSQATLRKILNNLRTAKARAGRVDPTEAEQHAKTLQSFARRMAKEKVELERKLREKDYSKKERNPLVLTPAHESAQTEVNSLRQKVRNEIAKQKKPLSEDYLTWYQQGTILSSTRVFGKLGSYALGKNVIIPVEDVIGGALTHVPGFRALKDAPRHGGNITENVKAQIPALMQFFHKAMYSDSWKALREGATSLSLKHGKKDYQYSPRLLTLIRGAHMAEKVFASRPEYFRSLEKQAQWAARNGMDLHDPKTHAAILERAYMDGQRAQLMQPNVMSKAFGMINSWLENVGRSGKLGSVTEPGIAGIARLGRFISKSEFPITRVPVNYVQDALSYNPVGGALKGGGRIALQALKSGRAKGVDWLIRNGVSDMSPEAKDATMRALKKGALGIPFALIGWFDYKNIGGYYQPGKRKDDDVPAGGMRVFGVNIPRFLIHNPLLETMHFFATMRRVYEGDEEKGKGDYLTAAEEASKGLAREVPFIDEPIRVGEAFSRKDGLQRYLGERTKGFLVPPDVQRTAGIFDQPQPTSPYEKLKQFAGLSESTPVTRKPTNAWQAIETGILGLRQRVPDATGLFSNESNFVKNELERLKFDAQEVYKPTGIAQIDERAKQLMRDMLTKQAAGLEHNLGYQKASDPRKALILREMLRDIRKTASERAEGENPTLARKLRQMRQSQREKDAGIPPNDGSRRSPFSSPSGFDRPSPP